MQRIVWEVPLQLSWGNDTIIYKTSQTREAQDIKEQGYHCDASIAAAIDEIMSNSK